MSLIRLMREIRFSIDRDWAAAAHGLEGFERALPVTNSWGGWPSAVGVAPYLVLRAEVSGRPDPVTGYLVNIKQIDVLLREHAIPLAARHLREHGVRTTGERLVQAIWSSIEPHTPPPSRLEALELRTTPFVHYRIERGDTEMVQLTQMFEFSAAHRLHAASLSDEENRRVFGKCNHPGGHGHNYLVEVTVAGRPDPRTGCVLPLPRLEQVVQREVVERLDHRHLNNDVQEFSDVNPSVENIARVVWRMLDGKTTPARLVRVRIWETAKTYAEYAGEGPETS